MSEIRVAAFESELTCSLHPQVQRVDYALRLLGDCLDIRRNLIEPNLTRARDYKYILQLGYYAAGLQHVFFLEGCACLALASFGANVR
jgi:hypothetical protein